MQVLMRPASRSGEGAGGSSREQWAAGREDALLQVWLGAAVSRAKRSGCGSGRLLLSRWKGAGGKCWGVWGDLALVTSTTARQDPRREAGHVHGRWWLLDSEVASGGILMQLPRCTPLSWHWGWGLPAEPWGQWGWKGGQRPGDVK